MLRSSSGEDPVADYGSLIEAAAQAREMSYSPYSHFRVGAALLSASGKVYTGCNIENVAYTPTMCAERVALGSAIASGERPGSFTAIAVVGDDPEPSTPCGVCRQILAELAAGALVVMSAAPEKGDGILVLRVEELLPHGFTFGKAKDNSSKETNKSKPAGF
ncbi:MAG: cytidine deaminase [Chloroflexota bacterium]|nr:cytidine deaminase [Chloroflexota bacterium]